MGRVRRLANATATMETVYESDPSDSDGPTPPCTPKASRGPTVVGTAAASTLSGTPPPSAAAEVAQAISVLHAATVSGGIDEGGELGATPVPPPPPPPLMITHAPPRTLSQPAPSATFLPACHVK